MALRFTSHSRSSATFKRGITGFRTPQARWTIVASACIKSSLIKGIHLGTAHRNKSGVLFDAVGVKALDPKRSETYVRTRCHLSHLRVASVQHATNEAELGKVGSERVDQLRAL